ncbi:WD40 repeat-like protein [Imleria badia]|nr:WD40 repeat-like protein [Imleria badia]
MSSKARRGQENGGSTRKQNGPSSSGGHRKGATTMEDESSDKSSSVHQEGVKPIVIDGRDNIRSVAFLNDGDHIVSTREIGKIRRWRVGDGVEVGTPMDVGSAVFSIAASRDGKWLVSGTDDGQVTVWNAESHEKVTEFKAHKNFVRAVDVSLDGTRIATGSNDQTVYIWSLATGKRLLGPLEHDYWVVAAKFSPDAGSLIATATWARSVRVYHSYDERLLLDVPIKVNSALNNSIAWAGDAKRLFALSSDGNIHCLDVSTGTTLSRWPIHSRSNVDCIALANNGMFIASSAGSSVSFWNTSTREQIGSVIEFTHDVWSMAISANYDVAISGKKTISLRSLCDILPSPYFVDISRRQGIRRTNIEKSNFEETRQQDLPIELAEPHRNTDRNKDDLSQSSGLLGDNIARPEEAAWELCNEPANPPYIANQRKDGLNTTVRPSSFAELRVKEGGSRQFEQAIQELHDQLTTSQRRASQKEDSLIETINALHARDESSNNKIAHLEHTNQELRAQLAECQQKADRFIRIIHAHEQKHNCESLYAQGRIYDAAESLMEVENTVSGDVRANKFITDWLAEFTDRCVVTLERAGDEASNTDKREEAVAAYTTALSLGPSNPNSILIKWARMMLIRGSAHGALSATTKFKVPRFVIYRNICEILEEDGLLTEAVECFRQMQNDLPDGTDMQDGRAQWELEFRRRCVEKLEKLGDAMRDSKNHVDAIRYYSNALSLEPTNVNVILLKRSAEVIELDPSSHTGYEGKHAALHGMGRHAEALEAFWTMLSNFDQSSDPQIRELRHQYIDATAMIQKVVEETIRHMPRVLIDTVTGRLYDKTQQATAFEELPIYDELRSSMTTGLDYSRIRREVKQYYRYVMFSHRWERGEPLFQKIQKISIYDLKLSPPNIKLQKFCELIRSLGFQWVWSDTCCIDKKDNVVLQESLVAMFTWYRGSSLTIVYLRGVWSHSQQPGDLWKSIWNTRAWTYQEYVAAETVQFYTEDWKLYLDLDVFNHKESPAIISEMEQASGVSAQELAVLLPGLERVREKLFLASMRQTTLVEDIAYSLLGIFNVAIPVIYGEGNRAVGRLLEHILTGSGDVTVLAWTGRMGGYNSCLPVDLTVYNKLVPPHVPLLIETADMDNMVAAVRSSLADLSLAVTLYDHLNKLPSPSVAASRLRLAGIIFPVTELVHISESNIDSDTFVYRATTAAFGDVEIKTTDDLSGMEDLLFIHPWISPLLDQDFSRRTAALDDTTRALRLVARLRQPFGALLLRPLSRVQYRRVATDCLIMVRVCEETSLNELIDGIGTIDIQ